MKLKTKLLIVPSILALIIAFIVFIFKSEITKSIKELININTPKIISMLEIEINLDEMHVSLYNTLNSYDRKNTQFYIDKYKDSISDQETYLRQLGTLSKEKKAQINFDELQTLLNKSRKLGDTILTLDNELKTLIQKRRDILNNNIEVDLDYKLQKNLSKKDKQYLQKLETLLEIEINIHELISAVRGYIIKNDKFLLDRVKDSESDISFWTNKILTLSWNNDEQKIINTLIKELETSSKLSDMIINFKLQQNELLNEYKKIDIELDNLIDNVINKKILQEHQNFNEELINKFNFSAFLLILISIIYLLLVYKIVNTLLSNIDTIISQLTNYNIDHKPTNINIKTNDEIEHLGQTINSMSSSIYAASLERNDLMKEMNTLNEELEYKILEVDQKEEILSQYILFSRTDPKGIITYASDFFCNLSGYSKDELIGSPHNIVRHPETPSSTFKDMWETIKRGDDWKGEIKNKAKEGHYYWVNTTISPEYNNDGSLKGYISIREDITAKKEFEKQHLLLVEQAKLAAMGEMIGNIAHQWRQPLSVITTAASAIELQNDMGMINPEEVSKYTKNIDENAQYLSKTIDTFRNFIKGEKTYKRIAIQDEISQAKNIVLTSLNNYHIKLKDKVNYDEPIYINLVSGELPQVIINIINNAKDIILEKEVSDGWIELNLETSPENISITIEDNAGGVPEDILPKIFEPYFSTKHQSMGTGLGLHMSYNIITESLKGKIYVKNTLNGAKFFIELPMTK